MASLHFCRYCNQKFGSKRAKKLHEKSTTNCTISQPIFKGDEGTIALIQSKLNLQRRHQPHTRLLPADKFAKGTRSICEIIQDATGEQLEAIQVLLDENVLDPQDAPSTHSRFYRFIFT